MTDLAARLRTPRAVDAAGVLACLVALALFWLAALDPALDRSADRTAGQTQLSSQQRLADELRHRENALAARLRDRRALLEDLPLRLEPAAHLNRRLAAVNELARTAGVTIDIAEVGGTTFAERYTTVAMVLEGRAVMFDGLMDLLRTVHERFSDMAVTKLEVSRRPVRADANLRIRVELAWYAAPAADP